MWWWLIDEVVLYLWWFDICVSKGFLSLTLSLGEAVILMIVRSEILNFWFMGYGQLLWEYMPMKQKECKLRKVAEDHMVTQNQLYPEWFCPWTFIFSKGHTESSEKAMRVTGRQRGWRDGRLCIYLTWKKELWIFLLRWKFSVHNVSGVLCPISKLMLSISVF